MAGSSHASSCTSRPDEYITFPESVALNLAGAWCDRGTRRTAANITGTLTLEDKRHLCATITGKVVVMFAREQDID